MEIVPEKVCACCGQVFPKTAEFFYHSPKRRGDGFDTYCKSCRSAYMAAWYAKHRVVKPPKTHHTCARCGVTKPKTSAYFAPGVMRRDGTRALKTRCRDCEKETYNAWSKVNPETTRARAHARRARLVAASGRHSGADVKQQYKRQQGVCYWCKVPLNGDFHVDHLIPLAKGGTNGPENIVCACPTCNLSKADKMPWEFTGRLL